MTDFLKKILVPIKEVQNIRGIDLPIGLEFLQLVVTGPPGAGKSYYINQIGGWPNEGFIDLSQKGWWRSQTLVYRPREVHLGMPFVGHREALAVFDKEWLDCSPPPILDLSRLRIPPAAKYFFQTDWLNRYIFEFLIPDPETIFDQRSARQNQGYFPVDAELSLEMVGKQVEAYQEIAIALHRAGMNVYIRKGIDRPPMRIAEKGVASVPRWAISSRAPRPSLLSLAGWRALLAGKETSRWLTVTNQIQQLQGANRIAHDGKTFEMLLGDQRLRFRPELPLTVRRREMQKNWLITLPHNCSDPDFAGFARIKVGETVVIGRSNKEYDDIFNFSKQVGKHHVAVTNQKGDLTITPLDHDSSVRLVRFDDLDYREQVGGNRYTSYRLIREIFGGSVELLPRNEALRQIRAVNSLLRNEEDRPVNSQGMAGGLLELTLPSSPVIVGDLHGQVDNILKILCENCLIQSLCNGKSTLIVLGDAIHSENHAELEQMDSSILMMDLLFALKLRLPRNFHYLRGNHDSFNPELAKGGICQGLLFRERLSELRGEEYVTEMQRVYDQLPYLVTAPSFYACHAAPPRSQIVRQDLIDIATNPQLIAEVTEGRLQRHNSFGGYNKSDIKALRQALAIPKGTPFIVGHTPLDPFGSIWKNVSAIKNHHIVYSAHQAGAGFFLHNGRKLIPLTYPAEPVRKIINHLT